MLAVRYVVLAALVVWLGGLVTTSFGDRLPSFQVLSLLCGAIVLLGLFVMKFVGPPPRAFIPRAAITALMLLILIASPFAPAAARALTIANLVLGFVLLFWYVRE